MERDSLTRSKIIVLDLGGYGSHVVARQVRRVKVYSEIFPITTPLEDVLAKGAQGVILTGRSGDAGSASREAVSRRAGELSAAGMPILVVGSGLSWLVEELKGRGPKGCFHSLPGELESLAEPAGRQVLDDFVLNICGCQPHGQWSPC